MKQKFTSARDRRVTRIRSRISASGAARLQIHKSSKNIYAQVYSQDGTRVVAAASSIDKELKTKDFGQGKLAISEAIGKLVAARAQAAGVIKVAFDRSGFRYHGVVKALAEGARSAGLEF